LKVLRTMIKGSIEINAVSKMETSVSFILKLGDNR